ncbi:MAG: hypothetical protein IT435_19020 [Phycisphaerales bacterium]|nr:hypothetical protein [Phycisphaerales bacterium]
MDQGGDPNEEYWDHRRSKPIDVRAIAGEGWVAVTLWTTVAEWTHGTGSTAGTQLELCAHLLGSSLMERQDFLIAFDCVVMGETNVELPSRPLRWESGYPASAAETLTLSWTAAGAASWVVLAAMALPRNGPDPMTTNRAGSNVITLFTIWESSGDYIRVVLYRHDPTVSGTNSTIRFIKPDGSVLIELSHAAFCFLRDTQILIGFAKDGSTYRAYASVGGTVVVTGTASVGSFDVRPGEIRIGDQNGANGDPVELLAFYIDDAGFTINPVTELQTLNFMTV